MASIRAEEQKGHTPMTKRVVYLTSALHEWVEIATQLQSSHGWQPCYWIAPLQIENHVRQAFPDATVHAFFDAAMGVPPPGLSELGFRPLDARDLDRFRKYETRALQMMDRHDSGNAFCYNERRRFFVQQLMYWLNVAESLAPDLVLFTESPHFASMFILYAVCVEQGIPTVMFAPVAPLNRVYVRGRIEDLPLNLRATYARTLDLCCTQNLQLDADIEEYIRHIGGKYSEAEPWYMRRQQESLLREYARVPLQRLVQVQQWPRYAMKVLSRLLNVHTSAERNYLKLLGRPMQASGMSLWQWARYRRRGDRLKTRLKKRYSELAGTPVPGQRYIYVPLHYQPERTSVPEGEDFGDQWLLVSLLAQAIPERWHLYVKEHSSQFSRKLQGQKGRTVDYYDELVKLKNVRLIELSVDPFRLMDEAEAVVTLTGTAGWESILRGTPVLVFGDAWYRACEGAFAVQSFEDCKRALDLIQKGCVIDQARVRAYLKAVETLSVPAYLSPTALEYISFSAKENITSLIRALESYVEASGLDQHSQ